MFETVTFTGARDITESEALRVIQAVFALPEHTRIISGGALGVDTVAALAVVMSQTHRMLHVVLPCTTEPRDVGWLEAASTWERMPPGTTFKQRDARMVEVGDRVIAFPLYPENDPRSKRSGTWMTVRLANRAGKPVKIHVLREIQ
jgi:hypothetical protein